MRNISNVDLSQALVDRLGDFVVIVKLNVSHIFVLISSPLLRL